MKRRFCSRWLTRCDAACTAALHELAALLAADGAQGACAEAALGVGVARPIAEALRGGNIGDASASLAALEVATNLGASGSLAAVAAAVALLPELCGVCWAPPDEACAAQAAWAVGNVAGAGEQEAEAAARVGVLAALCALAAPAGTGGPLRASVAAAACWALGGIIGVPGAAQECASRGLGVAAVAHVADVHSGELACEAAWVAADLAAHGALQGALAAPLAARLSSLRGDSSAVATVPLLDARLATPLCRALGHLASGAEAAAATAAALSDAPCTDALAATFAAAVTGGGPLGKEAAWAAANMAACASNAAREALRSSEPLAGQRTQFALEGGAKAAKQE